MQAPAQRKPTFLRAGHKYSYRHVRVACWAAKHDMTLDEAVKDIRRSRADWMIHICQPFLNAKLHVLLVWEFS